MENLPSGIITAGQNNEYETLQEIIEKCDTKTLIKAMKERLGRTEAIIFWNYFLSGCQWDGQDASAKQFTVIMAVLNELNKREIPSKQTFDIITRLFIELPKLGGKQLIDLCEYCIDSLRMGDIKCTGWRELLPEVTRNINDLSKINVHGRLFTGNEYRSQCLQNLLGIKWPESSLTVIASMFRDMPITKEETVSVLHKICQDIKKVEPMELPGLTFQLLALCTNASLIVIPLFSLNEYFHRHYYKPLFIEMGSDQTNFDSIEQYNPREIREAQDTIFYHLSNCTEFNIQEKDIVQQFRAQIANPRFILTPFLINALLAMGNVNRYFDSTRMSTSCILPFLRKVIENNENERVLYENSNWCRTTLTRPPVDLTHTFTVLIDQSKESTDTATPGLIGLAFTLLKTQNNSTLNYKGILFLEEFIKKRYLFGSGIVKKLIELLVADQDALQYTECLTKLSMTSTLTVSDCVGSIKEILDFFLLIPGKHAMRMMTFIAPLAKISNPIRDYLIETLRKAMYQSELATRQLGVYGFCMILKQLRNSNSKRGTGAVHGTQPSISGYSIFSQQMFNNSNNTQKQFDLLVLEIIGILRKCFNQTHEIKEILYEGLTRSMEFNPNLIPHILQFLDWHFRNYFDTNAGLTIKFDKCVREQTVDGVADVIVYDHLGKLLQFICQCIVISDRNALEYDTTDLKELLDTILERIDVISVQQLGLGSVLNIHMCHICTQYLNCIEALMYYVIHTKDRIAEALTDIFRLFDHHKESNEAIKDAVARKSTKKKAETDTSQTVKNLNTVTIFDPDNIWNLETLCIFLDLLLDGSMDKFDSKNEFANYILEETFKKLESMRSDLDYKQIKFSKSQYETLCKITAILFKKYSQHLLVLLNKYDSTVVYNCVECLRQCLFTARNLYERKFSEFLSKSDGTNMITELQSVFDTFITNFNMDDSFLAPIPRKLLEILEVLYKFTPANQSMDNYNWIYKLCTHQDLDKYDITYAYGILFNQWIKTQSGFFFENVATQIEHVMEQITDKEITLPETLLSMSPEITDYCATYLCQALQSQIKEVEYFIRKVKSFYAKWNIGGQDEQIQLNCTQLMKTTERTICSQLIIISKACIHLTNARLHLGNSMDNLLKTLTQLYICLTNLTRHFFTRHGNIDVSFNQTKFEKLLRSAGKPLAVNIYTLIAYIDDNILPDEEQSGANRKKNEKAKIDKNTRLLPKLIKSIENFNKHVISLSKKTKHQNLVNFLHIGTVRDFRIRSTALKEIIERNFQNDQTSDAENENAEDEDVDENEEEEYSNGNNESDSDNENNRIEKEISSNSSPALSRDIILDEIDDESIGCTDTTAAVKNLEAINRRALKRKQREGNSNEEVATSSSNAKRNRKATTKTARGAEKQ